MEETLKKLVYAGVGLAAQATEKIEETVNELVKKGKISDKEGKKIVDDFFKKSEKKKDSYETKFKAAIQEVTEKFNYVKKADYDKLAKKIAELEKQVKGTSEKKDAPKKAAKKVSKATAEAKKVVKEAING